MYKGVLTVAAATFVASATIIATNANTKDAIEDEAKVKQQNSVSKAIVNDTKKTTDTAEKGEKAVATAVIGSETNKNKEEVASKETKIKKASDLPPPPSPFATGKDKKADEATNRPIAPAKPVAMKAPKAPIPPEVSTANSDVATEIKKDTASQSEMKTPKAPMVDIAVPKKPVVVEKNTTENSQTAPKTNAKIEVATDPNKSSEASTKKSVTTTETKAVVTPADTSASSEVSSKIVKLKAPEAPVEIKSLAKPEVTELKAPIAPKGYLVKPIEISQNKELTTKKQSTQQPMQMMMPPQGMKMPQGIPPQMMMPPQGIKMPQRMPPQMMMPPQGIKIPQRMPPQMMMPPQGIKMPQGMPPQMINGQRMMMVPVYPINMGRPIYPYGYQMPFPNTMPQGNFQPRPIVKPNPQQAPTEKVEK